MTEQTLALRPVEATWIISKAIERAFGGDSVLIQPAFYVLAAAHVIEALKQEEFSIVSMKTETETPKRLRRKPKKKIRRKK